ncbi:hypothetical protein NHX12_033527 [Muraenolepis orangiensis]|uniref:Uncharacterized protein n=1 Tax=Muraenolepis orangiensis TaxID=630683 RepID=A0A9Q0E5Q1_9TELE|nr:hypothetical protein NHX12_033527 [Muraenolepis orangiensis]
MNQNKDRRQISIISKLPSLDGPKYMGLYRDSAAAEFPQRSHSPLQSSCQTDGENSIGQSVSSTPELFLHTVPFDLLSPLLTFAMTLVSPDRGTPLTFHKHPPTMWRTGNQQGQSMGPVNQWQRMWESGPPGTCRSIDYRSQAIESPSSKH